MRNSQPDDDFTPQEKQERFLRTLKAALDTPPEPRETKKSPARPKATPKGDEKKRRKVRKG